MPYEGVGCREDRYRASDKLASSAPLIRIEAVNDPANGMVQPRHCSEAVSSMAAA
jgi:hypothetical protein